MSAARDFDPPVFPPEWRRRTYDYNTPGECPRCGGHVPARWRHFMRICSCTYLPVDGGDHPADPECPVCDGTGFRRCEPQDLSVLRMSGACKTCGADAFCLVGDGGRIDGSGRHYDAALDARLPADGYHEADVGPQPLTAALGGLLDRENPS